MKGEISHADIMKDLRDAVLKFGEAKAAEIVDCAVSTLSNKIQPYDHPERRHFLTLREADKLTERIKDVRWLELLAAKHGFVLLPLDVTSDAATFAGEALQDEIARGKWLEEADPALQVHKFHAYMREIMETHKKRQEENGSKPVGFIVGQVATVSGFEEVLIPNEEVERQ